MTATAARVTLVRNVRIGRQGIYDADRQLVGYELLFRAYDDAGDPPIAGERATSQVIASTFGTFGVDNIAGGRPVFINFTRAFLTGIIPIPVEPDRVVVEVVRDLVVDDELVAGLTQLRDEGYRLALSCFHGEPERGPLLELVDYVSVDATALTMGELTGIAEQAVAHRASLMAIHVGDEETFRRCQETGFELFQGVLLQQPSVVERRMLSPSQLICVRLLNELADTESPIGRIEQIVGSDPGLALRLLRTANSASAGSTREVTSLRQALISIGPRRLRSWVVLTLLEGGTTTSSSDGLWSVLARAYTCRRLGEPDSDLAFTVGLLSGAAQMLGVEPDAVAEGAGLSAPARQALVDGAGPAGRALRAVLAHERDDDEAVTGLGLSPFDVSRAYLESLAESLKLVTDLDRA
jgi:c-di-GMP phosphodiesterase